MEPIYTNTTYNNLQKVFAYSFCQIYFHPNFYTICNIGKIIQRKNATSHSFSLLTPLQTMHATNFVAFPYKNSGEKKLYSRRHLYVVNVHDDCVEVSDFQVGEMSKWWSWALIFFHKNLCVSDYAHICVQISAYNMPKLFIFVAKTLVTVGQNQLF